MWSLMIASQMAYFLDSLEVTGIVSDWFFQGFPSVYDSWLDGTLTSFI